jgi:putative cell wall-binding protein
MVNSRLNRLTDEQKAFLEEHAGKNITIIGGEAAVSNALLLEMENYCNVERITGARREETALNVAEEFYPEAQTLVVAYSRNFPDALCGGPLAYALNCPLLLVNKNAESYAATYVEDKEIETGYVLGGKAALSDAVVDKVFVN